MKPRADRSDPAALAALLRPDCVHRDLYIDPDLFALEMQQLWRNTWIFVGHDSQVPRAGDYYTTDIATEPVILLRDAAGEIRVLANRCAHKGTKLVSAVSGSCGSVLRCPYHGWTYRLDGSIRTIPLKSGYDSSALEASAAGRGLTRLANVVNYRGFVFARLSRAGPGFHEYFGESLTSIDNMVERSPAGRLEVAGGTLRYLHDCNWKIFIENLNDTMHPMVAHESSAGTARDLWEAMHASPEAAKPMVIEQFVPFVSDYKFFDEMGVRIYGNGHSHTGVKFSIHSSYSGIPEYEARMHAAYGEERAHQILCEARHNTVYYPSLTIKGAIQSIRVVRPIAVDKTVIESWTFRLVDAPEELLRRTLTYSRLINAPTSVVGHDDRHCYRSIQEGLEASGNEWISLQRNFDAGAPEPAAGIYNGTSEISMRAQFAAWLKFMQPDAEASSPR